MLVLILSCLSLLAVMFFMKMHELLLNWLLLVFIVVSGKFLVGMPMTDCEKLKLKVAGSWCWS